MSTCSSPLRSSGMRIKDAEHMPGDARAAAAAAANGMKSKGARRTGPLRASVSRHYFFFFAAFLAAFLAPFLAAFFVAFLAAFLAMVKWV